MAHVSLSAKFESFLASNGSRHIKSASYCPATNGLAERTVQIVKRGLKESDVGSVKSRLAKFLFTYRLTPQPLLVSHLLKCSWEDNPG